MFPQRKESKSVPEGVFRYQICADFMVNLGDIGLNAYPATVDAAYAKTVVDNTQAQMLKYDGIWLYAVGNHDWDAGEGQFHSEQFLSDTFQKPWQEKAGENLHLTPGKVYCYYDIPEKGLRVILLNSTGTGTQGGFYYIFDEPQMQWLEALLAETPEDMDVLVMCHYMPHPLGATPTSTCTLSRTVSIILSPRAMAGWCLT